MNKNQKSIFCPIPWLFQAVRNNGDVRVCCQANVSDSKGLLQDEMGETINAKNGKLREARNAKRLKTMRQKFLKGEWPSECVRCMEEEAASLNSRRIYEISNWGDLRDQLSEKTSEDGTINTIDNPVRYLDLRFGNRCNLKCRMCGPADSDSWYSDYVALTGSQIFTDSHGEVTLKKRGDNWVEPDKSYNWFEDERFWSALSMDVKGLKHIYMAGGEPLLIRQHYQFLAKLVEKNLSGNIILEYNTNLTILPDTVVELWKNFKQVRVGASIDGIRDVFEFQRHPAKWDSVFANLQKLDNLPEPIISWMACTVTVYNVMHIPDFIKWKVEESNFKRINSTKKRPIITYHMAHKPDHLNVRNLSEEQKIRISNIYEKSRSYFREKYTKLLSDKAIEILDSIEKYMNSKSHQQHFTEQMIQYSESLDLIRNEDSKQFLP